MKLYTKIILPGMLAMAMAACTSTDTMDSDDDMSGMDNAGQQEVTRVVVDSADDRSNMMDEKMPQAGQTVVGGNSVAAGGVIVAEADTLLYFDFDQASLRPESREALMRVAAALRNSSASVRLEGHADERGTREYNIALGERRARAVADFLVLQGVSASRLETISYGEERPAVAASNESAWAMNRRVEIK